jgi:DNA-binding MarR family transcriptional regulator
MNGTQSKSAKTSRGGTDELREVLDSIRRIVRLLRLSSREAEREVGLTGAQLFVLQKLSEDAVLSVNELAERTHTHQSSVSVVVQALVDKGLISRSKAADDGRRLDLALTASAKSILRKAPGVAQDRLIEAIKRLPATTTRQLAKSLSRLVEEAGLDNGDAPMIFEDVAPPPRGAAKARGRGRRGAGARSRR